MRKNCFAALRRLAAYAAPALLVLIFFIISIVHVNNTMKQEAEDRAQDAATFLTSYLEGQLLSTESAASSYLKNHSVVLLSSLGEEVATEDSVRRTAYSLTSSIITFCDRNSFASDILLYFPNLNRIVGKNGCLTPYQYYKSLYLQESNDGSGYISWQENVLDCTGIQFLTYQDPVTQTVSAYHFQSTPVNMAGSDCDCVLLLLIDKAAVQREMLKLAESVGIASLQMTTQDDILYYHWQADDWAEQVQDIRAQKTSLIWKMDLETFHPNDEAYHMVDTLSHTLVIILLLASAMALLACVYFFVQNSRSLYQIQTILSPSSKEQKRTMVDMDWISNKVNLLYQKNKHQIETLNLQSEMLACALLHHLIVQNVNHSGRVEQLCNVYGVMIEYPNLKLFLSKSIKSYEELQWRMHMLQEKWGSNCFWFCWTMIEENCVILCNYTVDYSQMQAFLADLTSAIGSEVTDTDEFTAPEEIAERFMQVYAGVYHHAFQAQAHAAKISAPAKFMDALESENYKKARLLLSEIQQWAETAVGSNRKLCQRYAFLSQLYENTTPAFPEAIVDQLYSDRDGDNWSQILYTGLLQLAERQQCVKQSIPAMAHLIIEEEYIDTQLGLAAIAERLHVSQGYLSRAFKDTYQVGISTALNQKRISAAKAIMLNGEDNLKEIAAAVGFTSDTNFIRVFKKYEAVTPGVYRKDLHGNNV